MARPDQLYHFCCSHSRRDIGSFGLLVPLVCHPEFGFKIVWLTTEAHPDRERTGLTSHTGLRCDRMQYRYVVTDLSNCRAWIGSIERATIRPERLEQFEGAGDPEHWWIASQPVRARLDRDYVP